MKSFITIKCARFFLSFRVHSCLWLQLIVVQYMKTIIMIITEAPGLCGWMKELSTFTQVLNLVRLRGTCTLFEYYTLWGKQFTPLHLLVTLVTLQTESESNQHIMKYIYLSGIRLINNKHWLWSADNQIWWRHGRWQRVSQFIRTCSCVFHLLVVKSTFIARRLLLILKYI